MELLRLGRTAGGHGLQFLTIYIGPTLVLLLGRPLLVKVITIAKAHNATSIADFIAARYGKSQVVAALVTIMSLVAVLPYIALQLRAIGTSLDMLASASLVEGPRAAHFWRDSAFAVAIAMALFAIIFGVRHIHASEHHRGLMLAIAFEGLIKLLAMVGVSLFALFGVLGGPAAMAGRSRPTGACGRSCPCIRSTRPGSRTPRSRRSPSSACRTRSMWPWSKTSVRSRPAGRPVCFLRTLPS